MPPWTEMTWLQCSNVPLRYGGLLSQKRRNASETQDQPRNIVTPVARML